ncbi:ParB/RepB/Spo0J family partition protein [Chitinibacter tainanensis]|uniref:ParB/RepB/Spo0J family partition protein n=1 Tax=Chitinibacter tainanensis TaxID=230667 RepID=UPI00048E3ADE|nr:ParB/RepB/Spo0J family partition protein [Chitinibacter tainanensis]
MTGQSKADPRSLKPNPWNSNRVSPDNEAKLDASIQRRGMFKPIIVREIPSNEGLTLEILGGQHRCESAIRIGLAEVPIFNLGPISDEEAKEIGLLDNARYGADDIDALNAVIASLNIDLPELTSFMPISDRELNDLFAATSIDLDALEIPDFSAPEELTPEAPVVEPLSEKVKTHEILRFKVPVADAIRIRELIENVREQQGFTEEDALTNAGYALAHILFTAK